MSMGLARKKKTYCSVCIVEIMIVKKRRIELNEIVNILVAEGEREKKMLKTE